MWTLRQVPLARQPMHRLSCKPFLFGLAFGLLIAAPHTAMSQAGSKEQQPGCQADNPSSVETDRQTENEGSESKISRCKGVLTPPPTGDRGMVEPASPTGDMPVIRPGDTPQQAPAPKQQ